jgi:CheY-like chemotaxis protein
VRIVASLGGQPVPIVADVDRIQQIAWNLLSNAVKFTAPGGSVEVAIDVHEGLPRLVVRDTGQGIAPEFLPFVFERFRQANASTSRTEGGLGLGLALVRQLVELHGGRISAESGGRGKGALFVVVFPALKADAVSDAEAPYPLEGRPLEGVRLLVVDDEDDWRHLLSMALEGLGAVVTPAQTTAEALRLLKSRQNDVPDVILADIGMPNEDGYSFLKALNALGGPVPRVPVIAVTAYAGGDNEKRALAAGFRMQCTKPVDPDVVARAVLKILHQPA